MGQLNRIAPFVVLFAILVILQPILIALDCRQTPASAAKQFIENYYYLDADMQKWLCSQEGDNQQLVNDYLYKKQQEASQRGFSINYLRRMFTQIHVKTTSQGTETATVHITGKTRTAIHPAFMVIGKMFGLGQSYPVNTTLDMVRESGQWRVCHTALGLRP